MAYFKQTVFGGVAPILDARLLPENYAEIAENVVIESGKIDTIKGDLSLPSDTVTLEGHSNAPLTKSIFKYFYETDATHPDGEEHIDELWLQWREADISAVQGPVPADATGRVYWTGEGSPRISWSAMLQTKSFVTATLTGVFPRKSFVLGVPQPSGIISNLVRTYSGGNTNTQPPAGEDPQLVSYAICYVTVDGREGPPLYSGTVEVHSNVTQVEIVHQRLFSGVISDNTPNDGLSHDNYLGKIRVYRSNTGSQDTQYQFLKDVEMSSLGTGPVFFPPNVVTSIIDDNPQSFLSEVMPSADWVGPPDTDTTLYPEGPLKSLMAVGQGVMAGFTGKRLCFSEPFLPHAWPVKYRITIQDEIVEIARTNNGIVALTKGQPYFVTGTDPSAMASVKVDFSQACVYKNSVVEIGDTIFYAAPDGLCAITGTSGQVVTKDLISTKDWNDNYLHMSDYSTARFMAFNYEGKYVAFHWNGAGQQPIKGFIFDPRADAISRFVTLDRAYFPAGGYEDPTDSNVYLIRGVSVAKLFGGVFPDPLRYQYTYKTRTYIAEKPTSMGWLSVDAYADTRVKVYGDGVEIADYDFDHDINTNAVTQTIYTPAGISGAHAVNVTQNSMHGNPIIQVRLPAAVATEWQIEIIGEGKLYGVCIAETMDELRALS